jgi:hypothetical protein
MMGIFLTRGTIPEKSVRFSGITHNYARNLFSLLNWQTGPPQRGRPATARQADDIPIAIGRSPSSRSIYMLFGFIFYQSNYGHSKENYSLNQVAYIG